MKKRVVSIIAAAAMLTACALPVCAEDQTTTITATVPSSYILTIPANTTVAYHAASTKLDGTVKVTGKLAANETVTVTAAAGDLATASGDKLAYQLMKEDNSAFTADTWTKADIQANKSTDVYISIAAADWDAAVAGNYTGTITFTAEVG